MAKVFVSHSSGDREFIEREMLPVLDAAGIETWYSRDDIRISEEWERAILEALRSSDFFLLVMSSSASKSNWVRTELHFAMNRLRDRIVPVLIEDCDPLDFHLALPTIQRIDYRDRTPEAEESLLRAFEIRDPDAANADFASSPPRREHVATLQPPRSHFHCGPWVPPNYFIGREADLAVARDLIAAGQSFLIVGQPRAGKTSFCRKLKDEFDQCHNGAVLASYLNLQQFSDLTLTTFLEHTILSIIGEMARRVFGIRYSDLRRPDPFHARPELCDDANFASFVNIFRIVRQHARPDKNRPSVTPTTLTSASTMRADLDRHDFEQYCRDLLEIADTAGRGTFVMFYDEANRIFHNETKSATSEKISAVLLESLAEVLADSGLVGGYVASPEMIDEFRRLAVFGEELRLGPFGAIEEMQRLLARYYFGDASLVDELPLCNEALHEIWEASQGQPFLIQLLGDRSFRIALNDGACTVDRPHVYEARDVLRMERPTIFSKG